MDDYNKKRLYPPLWQHDYNVLKRLLNIIRKFMEVIPEKSIIADYGCGSSPYEELFKPKSSKYLKIDIGNNRSADIKIRENSKLPLKSGSVDVVLSTQVLEHVMNLPHYISESSRILKKKGILILSTHGIWPYHASPSDYYRFTQIGLRSEIEKYGFSVKNFIPILGPFAAVSQFTLLLIAERLKGNNIFSRIVLAVISLVSNILILIEDKIFPATKNSDASVFVLWAEKE